MVPSTPLSLSLSPSPGFRASKKTVRPEINHLPVLGRPSYYPGIMPDTKKQSNTGTYGEREREGKMARSKTAKFKKKTRKQRHVSFFRVGLRKLKKNP